MGFLTNTESVNLKKRINKSQKHEDEETDSFLCLYYHRCGFLFLTEWVKHIRAQFTAVRSFLFFLPSSQRQSPNQYAKCHSRAAPYSKTFRALLELLDTMRRLQSQEERPLKQIENIKKRRRNRENITRKEKSLLLPTHFHPAASILATARST